MADGARARCERTEAQTECGGLGRSSPDRAWRDAIWIDCSDGKRRPIPPQPEIFPLASGVPNRVGLLRGSGNAIVPQCAAIFIQAAEEARRER